MDHGSNRQPGRAPDDAAEWLAEGIAPLRGAVRHHVQAPEGDSDRLLRAVVTPIARASRSSGLDAARLVVHFKQAWHGLPEVDMLPRRDSQQLLDKAVTLLIEAYYAE
jgi:hypothetical protein